MVGLFPWAPGNGALNYSDMQHVDDPTHRNTLHLSKTAHLEYRLLPLFKTCCITVGSHSVNAMSVSFKYVL